MLRIVREVFRLVREAFCVMFGECLVLFVECSAFSAECSALSALCADSVFPASIRINVFVCRRFEAISVSFVSMSEAKCIVSASMSNAVFVSGCSFKIPFQDTV